MNRIMLPGGSEDVFLMMLKYLFEYDVMSRELLSLLLVSTLSDLASVNSLPIPIRGLNSGSVFFSLFCSFDSPLLISLCLITHRSPIIEICFKINVDLFPGSFDFSRSRDKMYSSILFRLGLHVYFKHTGSFT